ncbi:MAG: hypothetical protein AAGE98_12445 [Actinomycetota bacterium]
MSKKNESGKGKPPPPPKIDDKPRVPGAPKVEPFPLKPSQMIVDGIEGFRRAPLALMLGTFLPFLVSGPFVFAGQSRIADAEEISLGSEEVVAGLAFNLIGMVLAGAASYPVCVYALRAARDEAVDLAEPFRDPGRFFAMFTASFWFWAGILLGLNFFVLPAVFVFLFYVFFGFVLVDRPDLGGLKALGTSVRIGDKRRIALFALTALFGFLLFLCILPVGFGVNIATIALMYLLLLAGTAVSLVSWASLYDVLRKDLPDAW